MPSTLHTSENLVSRKTRINLADDATINSPRFRVNVLLKCSDPVFRDRPWTLSELPCTDRKSSSLLAGDPRRKLNSKYQKTGAKGKKGEERQKGVATVSIKSGDKENRGNA